MTSPILDPLYDYNLRAFDTIDPPVMATPQIVGQPGTTTYEYLATLRTLVGETTASVSVSVTNGPDTLSGINKILLQLNDVHPAAKTIRFYKKVGEIFQLLGEVDASVNGLYDHGQATTATEPPATNTSGRPDWISVLFHPARYGQRMEMMDLQELLRKRVRNLADTIHRNGDVIRGCAEQFVSDTTWHFTAGAIYLDGDYVQVPAGQVVLTGTGREKVGLRITPLIITYLDDEYLRNIDEGITPETYNREGADRLVLQVDWVLDQDDQILIKEFLDGQPILKTFPTERNELQKMFARRTVDVSGSFVVKNFGIKIEEHATDATKLVVKIGPGKAYPEGFEIETLATIPLTIPRARETLARNEETTDVFSIPGGFVIGTGTENFDVNGKAIKLKIGPGGSHTVTFVADDLTAAQVCSAIESSINAYPTSGSEDLVNCEVVSTAVKIQAAPGKDLTVEAVANDAYTLLGISTGTYTPTGQRIYPINDIYVKVVTDLSYGTELVESVVHDGGTGKDLLAHTGVYQIIGASNALVDCHDGKFDYLYGVDFGRTGNYIDFSLYGGDDPSNGQTYFVKYRYMRVATPGTRVLVRVIDAQIVKGSEDGQDTIVFTGHTSAISVKTGDPVVGLSGQASDVVRIVRVNDTPGQSQTEYSLYSLIKNSDELSHAASEIDWSAAGEQGENPLGQPVTSSTYYITFEFWQHATEGDYISADSYDMYEEIETIPASTGLLRDYLDLRTTGVKPVHDGLIGFDYEFFLARVDKIMLDDQGNFWHVQGAAALKAQLPRDQTGRLTLSVLYISPYTYGPANVLVRSAETMRITQRGLREAISRIERLEYFHAINQVETQATQHSAAADAKGVFVDPISGQNRMDVAFDTAGVSFSAAVDQRERCVRLPVEVTPKILAVDLPGSTHVRRVGNTIMLDYEPSVFDSQLKASKYINVNPDDIVEWNNGTMSLDPEVDVYMDEEQLPASFVNFDQNLAGFAAGLNPILANQLAHAQWDTVGLSGDLRFEGLDMRFWTGGDQGGGLSAFNDQTTWVPTNEPTHMRGDIQERLTGTLELSAGRREVDLGDRVIDVTVVPNARTKLEDGSPFELNLTVKAVYPLANYACEIAGKLVDLTPTGTSQPGTQQYLGYDTVKADNTGAFTAKFTMPEGIPAGQVLVRAFNGAIPDLSSATARFFTHGWRETKQSQTAGFETIQVRDNTFVEQQITNVQFYADPLAQTFLVQQGIHYISAVKLYVATKSASIPITVDIRRTANGYPTRDVIQSVTLDASEVQVSEDGSVATTFTFPNVVGFTPGEYAIVIMTNCIDYNVYCAELGGVDLISQTLILQQAHGGVLFHSPNNSTWEPMTKHDLKFELDEANFENDCQLVFANMTGIETGVLVARVSEFLGAGAHVIWSYSLDNGASWTPFRPDIDTTLDQVASQVKLRVDVTNLGGSYQIIEKWAGILLLLSKEDGDCIWNLARFSDPQNLPDSVRVILNLDTDGTNGSGVRSVTPYYSTDDENWVELQQVAGLTPLLVEQPYYEHEFVTPAQATVSGASNATPIVVTSVAHGHQENEVAAIAAVGGNTAANGTWRLKNVTDDTFELIHPDTGADSVGNGGYSGGGTIDMAEFDQCRLRVKFTTTNKALTPKLQNARLIAA